MIWTNHCIFHTGAHPFYYSSAWLASLMQHRSVTSFLTTLRAKAGHFLAYDSPFCFLSCFWFPWIGPYAGFLGQSCGYYQRYMLGAMQWSLHCVLIWSLLCQQPIFSSEDCANLFWHIVAYVVPMSAYTFSRHPRHWEIFTSFQPSLREQWRLRISACQWNNIQTRLT